MSMIFNLLRVPNTVLNDYLADSAKLEQRIYNDDDADVDVDDDDASIIDLDKAWDGIFFLLTGNNIEHGHDHTNARILFSGQLIDESQDMGYGPAHYLSPEQVAEVNDQIQAIAVADLKLQYDPKRMESLEIYPLIWDEGDGAFDYLAAHFTSLQAFYLEAAKNGEAVITFIN